MVLLSSLQKTVYKNIIMSVNPREASRKKKDKTSWHPWLMPVILATQGQIVHEPLSQKHPTQNRAGGVAQVVAHLSSKYESKFNPSAKTTSSFSLLLLCLQLLS
jgi:hypothetical protein